MMTLVYAGLCLSVERSPGESVEDARARLWRIARASVGSSMSDGTLMSGSMMPPFVTASLNFAAPINGAFASPCPSPPLPSDVASTVATMSIKDA